MDKGTEERLDFGIASRGLQTCSWVKYQNSCMHLMIKLWDIWHFSPFSSVLASFFSLFSCLIDILITGLCLYAGDACLLWMNFNTVFCWILLNILCIFVFFCLWFSYYFAHECIPCPSPKFTTKKIHQKP